MYEAILYPIPLNHCCYIAERKQSILISRVKPTLSVPRKVYIYCLKGKVYVDESLYSGYADIVKNKGKVIGEFICDRVDEFRVFENKTVQYRNALNLANSCLTYDEIANYIGPNKKGYAWHISQLKIYSTPKELTDFDTTGYCFNIGNVEIVDSILNGYVFHYSDNSLCKACKYLGEFGDCRKGIKPLTRAPRHWMYVGEKEY